MKRTDELYRRYVVDQRLERAAFGDEGLEGYFAPEGVDGARARGRPSAEYYLFERIRR